MFAILVILMIGIMTALVAIWLVLPSFREWIERPKYTMLARERLFERASRDDHQES